MGAKLTRSLESRWAWLAAALLALAILLINPVGFLGGGGDDGRYLDAARCWVANGTPCLPQVHWSTRWPLVASLAAATGLLGESRTSVSLGAAPWWALSLGLTGFLASRWFGRAAGVLALLLLALTPVFAASALQPSADTAELAFQLAALAAATLAYQRQSRGWAIAAGVLASIALQTRETSALFIGVCALAWLLLPPRRRNVLLWAIAGIVAGTFAEMLAYAAATGDPLYRFRLALNHVAIPSAALPANFDTRQSPLFNPAYIAAWEREAGIRLHWTLDPWLNLLASWRINVLLIATAAGAALFGKYLPPAARRTSWALIVGSVIVALLLVYGLAVDPKPRMFLPLASACAMVLGACIAAALKTDSRPVALMLLGAMAALQLPAIVSYPSIHGVETAARTWIAANPRAIETDEESRALLTLLPEVRALPLTPAGRPLRLATTNQSCAHLAASSQRIRVRAVAEAKSGSANAGRLCLLAYRRD